MTRAAKPKHVVVIGAGIVGLATAWFLQEYDVTVTVVDAEGVAAGASRANAGWITPAQAVPLTEPEVLRHGLAALFRPDSPFSVSPMSGPGVWWFLARFAAHCSPRDWQHACLALRGLNDQALESFDRLTDGGVPNHAVSAPVIAAFSDHGHASHLADMPGVEVLPVERARVLVPQLGQAVSHVLQMTNTRYLDSAPFAAALSAAVTARGGEIHTGWTVNHIQAGVTVHTDARTLRADAAVLATGAALSRLAGSLGVRVPVRSGRGYSFTVALEQPVRRPIYLPRQRISCTPIGERLRVAGTMEFIGRNAALRPRRIDAMIRAAAPLLTGIDWTHPDEPWVGARPITSDGLPLVGATRVPGVYVAGGHGMWGVTQGPVTGKLLAQYVVSGSPPPALLPLDPLR